MSADLYDEDGRAIFNADDDYEARLDFLREVEEEAGRQRVRRAARDLLAAEDAATVTIPRPVRLTEFLAIPDEPSAYRVDQVWPVGGRVVLSSQWKAGKTTIVGNLIRALVDGDPFLGTYEVTPAAGRVVLIDDELDERTLRRWLRDHGIVNTDAVDVLSLRGRLSTFNILDPACRTRWAAMLRDLQAGRTLFDCLRPALDALGLDESREAGRFFEGFDELLTEAGVTEALVAHHMGHTGERSRGDSRILDWPDAVWKLVRNTDDRGEQELDGPRFFSAFGRDVNVPEGQLSYDPETRRLSLVGGSRKDSKARVAEPAVLEYVKDNPGQSGRQITAAVHAATDHKRDDITAALKHLVSSGEVNTAPGPRRATLHYLSVRVFGSVRAVSEVTESECASALIERALHTHTEQTSERPAHSTTCTACGELLSSWLIEHGATVHPGCETAS
jgi:hypothetical protein